MKNSKLLKVTGNLMIIAGTIVILLGIISMFVEGLFAAAGASVGIEWTIAILGMLGGVAEFVAGIFGVKSWKKPEKAAKCIVLGVIVLVLIAASQILSLMQSLILDASTVFTLGNVATWLVGFVVPVLYLFGAAHLSEQAKK